MSGPLNSLYVYVQSGCGVCQQAKPIVEQFKRENLAKVLVIYIDASRDIISLSDFDPRTTPAYALFDWKHTLLKKHEGGLLTLEQLREFVFGDFETKKSKRKRAAEDEEETTDAE